MHLSKDKNNEEQTKLYHTVILRCISGKNLHNLYEVALQKDLDYPLDMGTIFLHAKSLKFGKKNCRFQIL